MIRSASSAVLQAFVHGPISQASKAEARRLQERVAELLAPMLDIITAISVIQVGALMSTKEIVVYPEV